MGAYVRNTSKCITGAAIVIASLLAASCSSRGTDATSANAKYCEFSQRLDQQDGPPTSNQVATLKRLAPAEIRPDVVAFIDKHDPSAEPRIQRWEKDHCK